MSGQGHILLKRHGSQAVFERMSYSYPLKILSPRLDTDSKAALAYILGYGGGLVGGDRIQLDVQVDADASLLLLTQGSTKVFKPRSHQVPTTHNSMTCRVASGASLFLLPDPVSCFGSADYKQHQSFHLNSSANLVLLDWFTSGRHSRGESWQFRQYGSTNEIRVDGKRVALDVLSLKGEGDSPLNTRLSPYTCYATVFLYGGHLRALIDQVTGLAAKVLQMQSSTPAPLLLSVSQLEEGVTVIRLAGTETEAVRTWLSDNLHPLQHLFGEYLYGLALG